MVFGAPEYLQLDGRVCAGPSDILMLVRLRQGGGLNFGFSPRGSSQTAIVELGPTNQIPCMVLGPRFDIGTPTSPSGSVWGSVVKEPVGVGFVATRKIQVRFSAFVRLGVLGLGLNQPTAQDGEVNKGVNWARGAFCRGSQGIRAAVVKSTENSSAGF